MEDELAAYRVAAQGIPVTVQIVDGKGKALFAQRDIAAGEVIFTETPLVCQPDLKQPTASVCSQCLKGCVTPSVQVRIQLGLEEKLPYEADSYSSGPLVHCVDCAEIYCSVTCRDAALSHHRLLCSRSPPPAPSLMGALAELCAPYDFVGPLMIARIFSSIIHRCMLNPGEDGLRTHTLRAFAPYQHFICDAQEEAAGCDEESRAIYTRALTLIKDKLCFDSRFSSLFSMEMFVRMNSLLQRNAQQICPRSPFELYRRGTRKLSAIQEVETERVITRVMEAYRYDPLFTSIIRRIFIGQAYLPVAAGYKLTCTFKRLQPDCVEPQWGGGTGLYFLHSCLNHSCEPNADVVFLHDNNRLSVVATYDIPAGTELEITYIEEGMSRPQRQNLLARNYKFHCRCLRCRREALSGSGDRSLSSSSSSVPSPYPASPRSPIVP